MKIDFCSACGKKSDLHLHHLVPKSKGGTDRPKNLITLCNGCHVLIHAQRFDGGYEHSQLVRDSMKAKKASGRVYCRDVYGFDKTPKGTLSKNPKEQRVILSMVKLRDGGMTYPAIADYLNGKGILSKRGFPWGKGVVNKIVRRFHRENA